MRTRMLAGLLMAAGTAFGAEGAARSQSAAKVDGAAGREFYQLRKYELRNGAQTALTQGYLERALIPALFDCSDRDSEARHLVARKLDALVSAAIIS